MQSPLIKIRVVQIHFLWNDNIQILDLSLIMLLFSHKDMSNCLCPHGLQRARLPCPSPSPRICSNSWPSSWWCHPTISSSKLQLKCNASVHFMIILTATKVILTPQPKYWFKIHFWHWFVIYGSFSSSGQPKTSSEFPGSSLVGLLHDNNNVALSLNVCILILFYSSYEIIKWGEICFPKGKFH